MIADKVDRLIGRFIVRQTIINIVRAIIFIEAVTMEWQIKLLQRTNRDGMVPNEGAIIEDLDIVDQVIVVVERQDEKEAMASKVHRNYNSIGTFDVSKNEYGIPLW